MGDKSKIEWTDATWNPIAGCSKVSKGCDNCYAIGQAHRLGSNPATPAYQGLTQITNGRPNWTGQVHLVESALELPLRWRTPKRIFVNSMSDLFHESVAIKWTDRIFAIMVASPQHTFQVLTKRPESMARYMENAEQGVYDAGIELAGEKGWCHAHEDSPWPPKNVWLGTSAEDQESADKRVPLVLQTPAAVRWVSYEPALAPVDFERTIPCGYYCDESVGHVDHGPNGNLGRLDWIVVGGESGPSARPFYVQWARDVIAQCKAAGVPCFVKQLGGHPIWDRDESARYLRDRKGGDPSEWPEDLRVREYPA